MTNRSPSIEFQRRAEGAHRQTQIPRLVTLNWCGVFLNTWRLGLAGRLILSPPAPGRSALEA
jgi:hypothetical protein